MAEIFTLNDAYSTTRRVTKTPPEFDGILLYPENVKQGGLRTKGLFKRSEADKPLISVVTVVYNGAEFLEETIKSVINQTYDNVEYIVVDGGSTDDTLDIIAKYNDKIDYWVSEKDNGIYNAMNKSLSLVSGKWLSFQNADDFLYENSTIEEINNLVIDDIDFVYGNYSFLYKDKSVLMGGRQDFNSLSVGTICHQAVLCKTNILKDNGGFNEKYKIAADYEFFVKVFKSGIATRYINITVSAVRYGGVSSKFAISTAKEKLSIVKSHYGFVGYCKFFLSYIFYVRLYLFFSYLRNLLV